MKFIKVHNIEGGDLLINVGTVATIYPRSKGGAIVNYMDGSTSPVPETVDEIEALLNPKEEQAEADAKSAVSGAAKEEQMIIESFLETMRDGINRECDRHRDCDTCRHKEQSFVCWFRSLTNREIVKIGAEYKRLRNFEQQENEGKTEKAGRWIKVPAYEACGGDYETWQAHGDPVAFYYCSECKEQAGLSETGEDLLTKYCPRCGARMVNGI